MPKLVYNEQILSGGIPKNQVENILGNFATEYDSMSTYAVGNYVVYDGLLYKCITEITEGEEFDSTKWEKTDCGSEFEAVKGELDELNSNLALKNTVKVKRTVKTLTTGADGTVAIPHNEIEGVVINAYATSTWQWLTVRQGHTHLRFYNATSTTLGNRIDANSEIEIVFESVIIS